MRSPNGQQTIAFDDTQRVLPRRSVLDSKKAKKGKSPKIPWNWIGWGVAGFLVAFVVYERVGLKEKPPPVVSGKAQESELANPTTIVEAGHAQQTADVPSNENEVVIPSVNPPIQNLSIEPTSLENLVSTIATAVVSIETKQNNRGTGFFVSEDEIIQITMLLPKIIIQR